MSAFRFTKYEGQTPRIREVTCIWSWRLPLHAGIYLCVKPDSSKSPQCRGESHPPKQPSYALQLTHKAQQGPPKIQNCLLLWREPGGTHSAPEPWLSLNPPSRAAYPTINAPPWTLRECRTSRAATLTLQLCPCPADPERTVRSTVLTRPNAVSPR